jgi:hypothetical protein
VTVTTVTTVTKHRRRYVTIRTNDSARRTGSM